MPVHDWTRVDVGTFHHFHTLWIPGISNALNDGILPKDYYAMAEAIAGRLAPDVLTLQSAANGDGVDADGGSGGGPGGVGLLTAAPRVRFTSSVELDEYPRKQRTLVIRHASDDRIVALLEIVSPGNKSSRHAIKSFVEKAVAALYQGYHLLIVDLHPPGPRDPAGIHAAIWGEIAGDGFHAPSDKPLTLAAYSAGLTKRAFVEPVAVGDSLADMPLFLEPDAYVYVPLEATYQEAYRGVPRRWKRVIEG